jgi:glyoxylase-like metal-dependent hydrolase (beta-lactamase superfamily II)
VDVERFESALWQTASLLLVEHGEAVVVDPCISAAEVETIAARARALGARVTHVLATHGDWDHVCGIAAFPDAVAAMGPRTAAIVARGGAAERIAARAAEYGLDVAGPPRVDRILEPGVAHRVGPFVVETTALPGHTPDGVAYRFRAAGVLAVGDHLSAAEFPFASSTADYRATLAALVETLRHDPPARVVPGHGPELSAAEALAIAEADLAYLRALRGAVLRGDDALAVPLPRPAPDDLAEQRAANVEAQIRELTPHE